VTTTSASAAQSGNFTGVVGDRSSRRLVLVAGSVNQDIVLRVNSLPAPGETVLARSRSTYPGGKGANQAVAAARAGAAVAFLGCVGHDDAGAAAAANLRAAGVDTRALRRIDGAPTGAAYVAVTDDGENSIVVAPGANAQCGPEQVDAAADLVRGAALVVTQLEIALETVARLLQMARRAGVPVLLNAAPAIDVPRDLLRAVEILVVNEREANALVPDPVADDLLRTKRLTELGPSSAVLTLGARGAVWRTKDRAGMVPAPTVDVVDSTGAGDAFVGALAAAVVGGRGFADAVAFAVEVASQLTTVVGAQFLKPPIDPTGAAPSR
jgi:ribokinase